MDETARQKIGDKISDCVNKRSFTSKDMDEICQLFAPPSLSEQKLREGIEQIMSDGYDFSYSSVYIANQILSHIEAYIRDYVEKVKESQDAKTHSIDLQHEQEIVERIFKVGDKLLEMLYHADFSSGVEAYGVDEGRVRGYEMMKELESEWQALKKQEGVKWTRLRK